MVNGNQALIRVGGTIGEGLKVEKAWHVPLYVEGDQGTPTIHLHHRCMVVGDLETKNSNSMCTLRC